MDRGVKRVIRGCIRLNSFKAITLLTLMVCFSLIGSSKAFASDNVLQAIQIDGVKDSYTIVLRSDDSAEIKKTIQAPNKMIIDLKGIRASKSINTIYNNTASVDSVVVEPTGADSVKILVQADNVSNAEVQFDTLKTPLGVLGKSEAQKNADQLVLSKPMESYTPVYDESEEDADVSEFSLSNMMAGSTGKAVKQIFKSEKISWMLAFGMLAIMLISGVKGIKGKDSQIRVGLSQSLKERELDLYREMGMNNPVAGAPLNTRPNGLSPVQAPAQPPIGANYGLKAYQNGTKNPYVSSEIQRPRPMTAPKQAYTAPQAPSSKVSAGLGVQNTIAQKAAAPSQRPAQPAANRSSNIDSMKFLESMTKIYEKNGRTDLAQGLKQNMKKAKMNAI
jgi:hypothetical protein